MRTSTPFYKVVIPYVKLIRPINIGLVFLTQCILYFGIIYKMVQHPALNYINIFLLSICTCTIAACGNIINDYFDSKMDIINKPHKTYIGLYISKKNAIVYYWSINLIGFLIALFIAIDTENLPLLPIFPVAQWLLYFYAKTLKTKGLIGNVIVALMTSFVAIIIMVAERNSVLQNQNAFILLSCFACFAFIINFIRELTKDLEDIEGDLSYGSQSFPITYGVSQTKTLIYFNMVSFLIILSIFHFSLIKSTVITIYLIFLIITPCCYFLLKMRRSNTKKEFHEISSLLKGILLSGLIYILTISYFQIYK